MRLEAVTECEHGSGPHPEKGPGSMCRGGDRRVASTSDLVEELKVRGAEVLEVDRARVWAGQEIWPGSYLVFQIEDSDA